MGRADPIGVLDESQQFSGDRGWVGVDMRDPSTIPPGFASVAINTRFRNRIPEPRYGMVILPWLNKLSGGQVQPWGTVYGRGRFRDPNTRREYLLLASDGNVYACLANNAPIQLGLPSGVTITTKCRFQQAYDVVILFRGEDDDRLFMDDITTGFREIQQTPAGSGTLPIAAALRSEYAGNRVWTINSDDFLLASDQGDYTRYTLEQAWQVNQGSDDRAQQVRKFGKSTLVILKERSVHQINNINNIISTWTASMVTERYGCVAPETAVDTGSDFLWLSQEGIASLTLTEQNEVQAAQGALSNKNRMFSEKIQPLVARINPRYASTAVGAIWNDFVYFAVPLDGAEAFGPELLPVGSLLNTGFGITIKNLQAGRVYRWEKGSNTSQIVNGTETLTNSGDFTAQGTTATITVTGFLPTTMQGSLRQVYKGVNNAMLVYDIQNGEWCGHDEADGFSAKDLFAFTYLNRERLFAISHEGFIVMLEEDDEDALLIPYTDVEVTADPAVGDTIQVNSGTTVTGHDDVNTGSNWNVLSLGAAQAALWAEEPGNGGYDQNKASNWTAPNTLPVWLQSGSLTTARGVRFLATNGVVPSVTTTGTWATVTEHRTQPIVTTFVSRGYINPDGDLSEFQGIELDLQTWKPDFSVTILSDGVNEDQALTASITKSQTAYYYPFDAAPYDITNVNDDFETQGREDYSITPDDAAYEMTPGTNVRGNLLQETREPFEIALSGRSARVKIVNAQGRVRIMQCRLTANIDYANAGPIAS